MEEELEVDYEAEDLQGEGSQPADDGALAEEVYGDLFDERGEKGPLLQAKHATLQEECRGLRATIAALQQEAQAAAAEREAWQEERRILVRNISCIFRTAREELDRKDAALQERDAQLAERGQRLQEAERTACELRAALSQWQAQPVLPPPPEPHAAAAPPAGP